MKVKLFGQSGKTYEFSEYTLEELPHITNAIYIYAKKTACDYEPIYIGETTRNVNSRYMEHVADGINECAKRHGANTFLLYFNIEHNLSESTLLEIESDLLGNYNTPCNKKNN